ATRYSPMVRAMAGGGTRKCFGILKSPSYCIMPAKRTSGRRPRSILVSSGPSSKAREISMARSPRKLKKTTASPSPIGPTRPPPPGAGHQEARQELAADARLLGGEGLDGGARRRELPRLAVHVRVPAALHDAPVGLVAVHRRQHAPAAGGDAPADPGQHFLD